MRAYTFYPILILGVILFQSCGGAGDSGQAEDVPSTDSTIVIQGLSKVLSLKIPKDLFVNSSLDNEFNENFGQIELRLGDSFEIYITEEQLSLLAFREELENDQLFSYQFEVESDSELVFQSILPDGNPHSYQFVKSKSLPGIELIVRTAPMGNFNQQQLKRMEDAVATLSLAE